MRVVDLFAGCGGLSLGFIQNGAKVIKAVEFDASIADTYKQNHPQTEMIVDDIQNLIYEERFARGEAEVVIGGPPCQGFSMAGARIRNGFIDDPRNYLFRNYFNVVSRVRPELFIMENVRGIATMQEGRIFEEIQQTFQNRDLLDGNCYQVMPKLVKAVEFGIPQKRERMILIGLLNRTVDLEQLWNQARQEIEKDYPDYFKPVTVADAIGNLPEATISGEIERPVPATPYQQYLAGKHSVLHNHKQTMHSRLAVDRMRQIHEGENYTRLEENIRSVHSGAYGRLCWDEAAPTITTRFDTPAGGRFIHPVRNRTLTPREAARIQSFPDDFVFYGTKTSVCKQIGNAVPPKISYFLARFAELVLKEGGNTYDESNPGGETEGAGEGAEL